MAYKHAIFMRLGVSPHNGQDGPGTVREYEAFLAGHGEAWLPVGSLGAGMSERMRCEFADAIDYHETPELYIALGKAGGGGGDIALKAEVVGIARSRVPIPAPEPALTPAPWADDKRCTWLKIRGLKPAGLTADDFVVINTGSRLSRAIAGGQYHFGYIKRA